MSVWLARLAAVAPLLSAACVIPVGPEFQDPIGSQNSLPYFYGSTPVAGATVTMTNATFQVTPADPDVQDTLYVRWLANYPSDTRILAPNAADPNLNNPVKPTGNLVRSPTFLQFGCQLVAPSAGTEWLIMAVLSDSPFPVSGPDLTVNIAGSTTATRTWTLLFACTGSN